ncbi:uncharacterized protein TA15320 [Theileria annulata]|uniref:Uncharacterized protein n=1 Tax=Theileria annulata TaxID=5874 RepID=Q4UFF6_THEAN|nr:uncharacterized protein TA15320 [Theileria annulata]CAI74160.1 hypothetical protein, conserved [Theileria annulata]|eukprot:XP_951892.1 hypothetical protein, conserved [Theileria annulata]
MCTWVTGDTITKSGGALDDKGECQDCTTECDTTNSIKLQDALNLSVAGDAVTLNGTSVGTPKFESNATITITSESVDFTELTENVTIKISTGGTIKNSDGNLTIGNRISKGEVLKLDATGEITEPESAKGKAVNLKGTIVVTSTGQAIGSTLTISGGPSSGVGGSLTLTSGAGNVTIQNVSNLKITSTALTSLKGATGTLKIGTGSPDTPVKYKIFTSNTIILGLNTLSSITANADGAKVTLKGVPTSQITIAPNGTTTDGINATLNDITFTKDDNGFTSLKGDGATLTLAQTFTGAKIIKSGGQLTKDTHLTEGTELKLECTTSTSGTTITITNIKVTSHGKSLNGADTYNLIGGITGTLSITAGGGGVTGNLTITGIGYDSYEIHDKHQKDLCCYYGKVYKWTQ